MGGPHGTVGYVSTNLSLQAKIGKKLRFRIRIPLELQPFYDDRKEIKRSLKTADLPEAKRRAREMAQQQHAEFDEFRAKRAGPPKLVLDGGDASIEGICTRWRHEVLGWDAASRVDRPPRIDPAESRDNRLAVAPLLKEVLITGKVERVEPVLRFFLHALNVRLDCSQEDYRRFLYRFAETLADTNRQQIQRNEGMVVPTPPEPASRLTLEDLFADWKRLYQGGRQKTIDKVDSILEEFQACVGKKPADAFTRTDVIAYRDYLLDVRKRKPKTVDTKITLLAAVFSVAVDDGKLPTNPAARIRIPKSDTKAKRLPFSQSDLKTLLNSSIYTANFRPKGGKGEAAVWLPVLSLFSGNREEELGQLRVDDVRCQGGIWHLNILEDDDEQGAATKVKNKASWRKLPLHSAVIEAGFLRYVERIKAAGHVRLFPELTPDKYNVLTSRWSKWFHRYLRITLGIINRKKVFHSLRHNFRDACRDGGVDEEMADRLMGHKGSGDATGRGYGRGFSLEKLKEAMDKINYSGLEIPIIETEPEG